MKITPIRNISNQTIQRARNIKQRIPRRVTLDNLPTVAGTVGLFTPIPFASVAFFSIGKAIQLIAKKYRHKKP